MMISADTLPPQTDASQQPASLVYSGDDVWGVWRAYSRGSAAEVVPLVTALIPCESVIDVGCGEGIWLDTFRRHGTQTAVGVDGEYVDRTWLQIPGDSFVIADLSQPLHMDRQFDLAVSLEVAEHLPSDAAETFVDSLTRLAPAVLFSAAIPYQGGTHHVNEQWPEFWAELFARRGYVPVDCLRRKLLHNPDVVWYYAQNMLLFVTPSYLKAHPGLQTAFDATDPQSLTMVHPEVYLKLQRQVAELTDLHNMPLRKLWEMLPVVAKSTLRRRLGRLRLTPARMPLSTGVE